MITDGLQTTTRGPYTPLDQASQTLKDKGVTIFSLGIGPNIAIIELLQMASDEQHVYNAESFNQLQDVVKTVTQGQCKGQRLKHERMHAQRQTRYINSPFYPAMFSNTFKLYKTSQILNF